MESLGSIDRFYVSDDNRRMARIDANKSTVRLDLRWYLDLFEKSKCTVLQSVRCWVRKKWFEKMKLIYLNRTLSRNSYTSLGDKTNTVPNPHLKYFNKDTGKIEYYPAHHLKDGDAFERVGRLTNKAPNGSWFRWLFFFYLNVAFVFRINCFQLQTCYLTPWWAGFLFWWWFDRKAKCPFGHLFA